MSSSDHDPVEDFFERERDQIVSHHGNDLHWQSILRQARGQRRSRFLGYAAGLAAAGLVIGGITYGAVLRGGTAPVSPATQVATTADRSASAAAAAKAAAAAAAKAAADAKAAAEARLAQARATYALIPNGGTVGVGMPVTVQFASPVVTKAERVEVEKRVKVTTVPAQQGAWGWLDNRQLMWRPSVYWLPGTKVTLSTPLHGVKTGPDGTSFTVGAAMVSTVDMKAHTMTVRRDGKVIRRFPVSTGRPGALTETRYGTKVIIERNNAITMDSATVGIPKGSPGYYKIDTKWNLRVTWTGEFIQSAPWSVNSQGTENVSHGCTNLAPADAEWMFNNSKMGDIVTFTGSSRAFKPTEGIGVWVYDFAGWKAQSALV